MKARFVKENDEITSKVGKYSAMEFTDVYKPKHYLKESAFKSGF